MATSANALRAGRANIELKLGGKDATLKALRNVQARAMNMSRTIMRAGAVATGAGVSILAAFAKPLSAASDLQETMSKFDTVFGDNAGAMKTWGDGFAKQVGRSEKQVASFLSNTQDLLVPMGLDANTAGGLSKQLTQLAVDLGSFNNVADEDAMRDLHAAMTGSGETLKKYGVVLTEAGIKQELLNQGIQPDAITEQAKVMARMNIIMRATTAAQGDATKTAGSYANQVKRVQGQMQDLAATIGQAILPAATKIVGISSTIVSVLKTWSEQNQSLARTVAAVGVGLTVGGALLVATGGTIALLTTAVGGLASAFAFLVSPAGLTIAAIAGVTAAAVAGVNWFARYTETGRTMASSLREWFGRLLETARRTFGGIAAAVSSGQLKLAMEIGISGMRVSFLQGIEGMRLAWSGFVHDLIAGAVTLGARLEGLFSSDPQIAADLFAALAAVDRDRAADAAAIRGGTAAARGELDALVASARVDMAEAAKLAGADFAAQVGGAPGQAGGAGIYSPGGVFDTRFAKQIFAGPQDQQVQLLGKIERNTRQRPGGIGVA